MSPAAATQGLAARIRERETALRAFVSLHGDDLARACHAMARAFAAGGRLVCVGRGPAATDAAHAAVEFMHPVIVGKRALPALALSNDPTGSSTIETVLRPGDILLAIAHSAADSELGEAVVPARDRGALTIALHGPGEVREADFSLAVSGGDPLVAQEVQETAYHVLWELVHVFFEHPGLLEEECITCGDVAVEALVVEAAPGTAVVEHQGRQETVATDLVGAVRPGDRLLCHAGAALQAVDTREAGPQPAGNATSFLYPFLSSAESDLDAVLADVRRSTVTKADEVIELRRRIEPGAIHALAEAVRARLEAGGRLISFGNGGSSTDAQDLAGDLQERGWPAIALTNDVATVTAVANDVGFEQAFARQLIALGRPDDIAVAISTSGSSPNLIAGLERARERGMLTVAIVGSGGGRLAEVGWVDHVLHTPSDYIPRVQEAQATAYHLLVEQLGEQA